MDREACREGAAMTTEQHPTPYDTEINDTDDDDPYLRILVAQRKGYRRAKAEDAEMLEIIKTALEQTEDGLHDSPCDVEDCWVEAAQAAIARAEATP